MRDLNAAYGVVGNPDRRAEHDRLRAVRPVATAPWSAPRRPHNGFHAEPETSPEPGGPCWRHARRPSVDACHSCGVPLCSWCASLFEPAGCAPCVLRQTGRAQRGAVASITIFAVVLLALLDVGLVQFRTEPLLALLVAYVGAATALGVAVMGGRMWRSGWLEERQDQGFGLTFLVWAGILIGWLGAPVLLAKLAWDLKRRRRLSVRARSVLEVG